MHYFITDDKLHLLSDSIVYSIIPIEVNPTKDSIKLIVDDNFSWKLKNSVKLVLKVRQEHYPRYDLILDGVNPVALEYHLRTTKTHPLLQYGFVPLTDLEDVTKMYQKLQKSDWDTLINQLQTPEEDYELLQRLRDAAPMYDSSSWNDLALQIQNNEEDLEALRQLLAPTWIYYTTEHLLEKAQTTPSSDIITLRGARNKDLLFDSSQRGYTGMTKMRPVKFPTIILSQAEENTLRANRMLNISNIIYLPVTRYAEGMSKGAYYKQTNQEIYCGTFYYLEPESEVLLTVKQERMIYFKNKVEAAAWLIEQGSQVKDLKLHYYDVLVKYYRSAQVDKAISQDLVTRDIERFLVEDDYDSYYLNVDRYFRNKNTGQYNDSFYAKEDPLDQVICEGLKEFNYDVALLGIMAGARRAVAEVLDTRSREQSYSSLVYLAK